MAHSRAFHLTIILCSLLIVSCAPFDRWTAVNRRTAKAFHQGDYQQAINLAHKSLAMARTHFSDDHHYIAVALNNLIFLHSVTGHYQEAEILLYQMLTLKEMTLNATHPQIGLLLLRLSEIFRFEGNYQSAMRYGSRAATLLEQQFPANHPLALEAMSNLAFIYKAQFEHELAENLFRKILTIREKYLGINNPKLKPYLLNLESIYRAQGRYNEAIAMSRRSLAISSRTPQLTNYRNYSQTLFNLANLYFESTCLNKAEPLARQLIEYDREHFGKLHPRVATDFDLLAKIHIAQKRFTEAESLYRRAISIQQVKLPATHPHRKMIMDNYIDLLSRLGKTAEIDLLKKNSQ